MARTSRRQKKQARGFFGSIIAGWARITVLLQIGRILMNAVREYNTQVPDRPVRR